jgi:hypothetical protein
MDQHDLVPADMRPIFGAGAMAPVSEILTGKTGFSLKQSNCSPHLRLVVW